MRKYAIVSPMFWVRGTGKRLRGHAEAQLVALFLMTCPAASIVGIFPLALPTLCHETGLSPDAARKGLAKLAEEGFAHWDEAEELVWVPALPLHQVGDRIAVNSKGKKDHRHKAIVKALAPFKGHRFYDQFVDRYGSAYLLESEEGKDPERGLQAPHVPVPVPPDPDPDARARELESKPLASQKPPRDRLRESLEGRLPHQREDVLRVFDAYKLAFALPNAKLTRGDVRAEQIAERIDDYGEAACVLVAQNAPQDGMVSGKADERGYKHTKVEYVFGNASTFERILHEAQKREGKSTRQKSAREAVAEARRL